MAPGISCGVRTGTRRKNCRPHNSLVDLDGRRVMLPALGAHIGTGVGRLDALRDSRPDLLIGRRARMLLNDKSQQAAKHGVLVHGLAPNAEAAGN